MRRLFHSDAQVLGDIEYRMLVLGKSFTVKDRYEGVSDGSSVYYVIANEGSKNGWIINVDVTASGKSYINIYFFPELSDKGTLLPIVKHNMLLATYEETSVKVYRDPTITSTGTLGLKDMISGGIGKRAMGSMQNIGFSSLMPPGTVLLIEVVNESGATADVVFEVNWWEE